VHPIPLIVALKYIDSLTTERRLVTEEWVSCSYWINSEDWWWVDDLWLWRKWSNLGWTGSERNTGAQPTQERRARLFSARLICSLLEQTKPRESQCWRIPMVRVYPSLTGAIHVLRARLASGLQRSLQITFASREPRQTSWSLLRQFALTKSCANRTVQMPLGQSPLTLIGCEFSKSCTSFVSAPRIAFSLKSVVALAVVAIWPNSTKIDACLYYSHGLKLYPVFLRIFQHSNWANRIVKIDEDFELRSSVVLAKFCLRNHASKRVHFHPGERVSSDKQWRQPPIDLAATMTLCFALNLEGLTFGTCTTDCLSCCFLRQRVAHHHQSPTVSNRSIQLI